MNQDRRRAPRVPVSVSATEFDPRTTTPIANLSRTGALVVHAPMHAIGAHIELRFVVFPDDPILFVHTGRVVRLLPNRPAMGVEFDPMTPETEALLDLILRRSNQRQRATRPRRRAVVFDAHQLQTRELDD